MDIYYQDGICYKDIKSEDIEDNKFYILEENIDGYIQTTYNNDDILYQLDTESVDLDYSFINLLFNSEDEYNSQKKVVPYFIDSLGYSSKFGGSKDLLEELINNYKNHGFPVDMLYKHLYLVDCKYLISTLQNLYIEMNWDFMNFYKEISLIPVSKKYLIRNDTLELQSLEVSKITNGLRGYFTKACSILDIITKIIYELEGIIDDKENMKLNFEIYKILKSKDKIWGDAKYLNINKENTLFEKSILMYQITALRNELVHNGSWESKPRIFVDIFNNAIQERYMYMPDFTEEGHVVKYKNRKAFFSQHIKVNDFLPNMHLGFLRKLKFTLNLINQKYGK